MRLSKRLVVWVLEMLIQAISLSMLLITLFGHDPSQFGHAVLVFGAAIAMMFFLTGYLLTTASARLFWEGSVWWYSAIAVGLFLLHFELLNLGIGGAFQPYDRHLIFAAGSTVALLTSLVGSFLLEKWIV